MKRVSIIFLFLISTQLVGQWTTGFKVGLSGHTILGEKESGPNYSEERAFSSGFTMGPEVRYRLNDIWKLRFELLYTQYGGLIRYRGKSFQKVPTPPYVDDKFLVMFGETATDLTHINSYVELPIGISARLGKKFEFNAGIQVNYMVGSRSEGSQSFSSDLLDQDIEIFHSYKNFVDEHGQIIPSDFGGNVNYINVRYNDELRVIPQVYLAYGEIQEGEIDEDEQRFNRFNYGVHMGFKYFFNSTLFLEARARYAFSDVTNDKVDYSKFRLNPDNSLIFQERVDRDFGVLISLGFSL